MIHQVIHWLHILNPEGDLTWTLNPDYGAFGLSNQCTYFNNFDQDGQGRKDDLQFPFQFSNPANPVLRFDVAYARYSGAYRDSLEVLVSSDCGATWTVEYEKTGTDLATAPDQTTAFFPAATQWRTDSIDLTGYAGQNQLLIRFRATGRYGNNLFLDNIQLNQLVTNVGAQMAGKTANVFPNPVNREDNLWISLPTEEKYMIRLIDLQGKTILSKEQEHSGYLSLHPYRLTAGVYLLQIKTDKMMFHKKVEVR